MLHTAAVDTTTLELLKKIQQIPQLSETRLVGGTALALQIGHRKSVDLDIFGKISCDAEVLKSSLSNIAPITLLKETENIHIFLIDKIKVDIVNYKYPWIDNQIIEQNIILASIKDIAAMKISAIIGRGTKKDFIDLAFLLQSFTLNEILNFYQLKYIEASIFMAMKSLTYFADADDNPMPFMFSDISWEEIKTFILNKIASHSI